MNVQKKIFLSAFSVVACLIAISAGIGLYVARDHQNPVTTPVETEPNENEPIAAAPFELKEGYSLDLVDGWELVSHTPDRQVDRYRFERQDDPQAIFTISIYDKESIESFDDLIETRYGASVLSTEQDVKVDDFQAKKVTAEFLNMGLTADMLVQVNPSIYISLYGVQPAGENMQVQSEIDYMQNSFKS